MPALPWEIEQALEENVKLMPSWGPHKVLMKNGKVSGMELIRCVSVYDKSGRFAPTYDENVKTTVECDAVIMAVGYAADLKFAEGTVNISRGIIVADHETQATNKPGIFAGGAAAHGPATVIDAITSGKRAASSIDSFLKKGIVAVQEKKTPGSLLKFNNEYLKPTTRLDVTSLPVNERKISLEDTADADLNQINDEANRCFNCGCVSINATDTGVVLEALNAKIKIVGAKGTRTIPVGEFFGSFRNNLEESDIVTEIQVPPVRAGIKQSFIKFRQREAIDFALASVASIITEENGVCSDARIVLGAVAPIPVRAVGAEKILVGKVIDEKKATEAAQAVVRDTMPLGKNDYKVAIVEEIVRRAILAIDSSEK
jgi:CO/xanthine dehydrogenase FAD-binding subunit